MDLPGTIPIFPLAGAVLMPRMRLPLQIFEPRYLQMIEDVLKTPERLIGMIQPTGDTGELARIGCAGRIVSFTELEDRRLMISLRAQSRFRLHEKVSGFAPYLRASVDWGGFEADLSGRAEKLPQFQRPRFLDRLARYAALHELTTDWEAAENADDEMLVNSLSMILPFAPEEKQALLECATLAERRDLLDGLLQYALRGGHDEEKIQ